MVTSTENGGLTGFTMDLQYNEIYDGILGRNESCPGLLWLYTSAASASIFPTKFWGVKELRKTNEVYKNMFHLSID
jgi:hypothetical protein